MNKMKLVYSIIGTLLGAFIFVYGGYDDSPGAQGLGLLIVIVSIVNIVRSRKNHS